MRRIMPVLLVAGLAVLLTSFASASIPPKKFSVNARVFSSSSQIGTLSIHQPGDWISPLDFYPYYGEFYLHQFAMESPTLVRQRSYRFRLSNVAWGLSRRAASLRHALARMMP